MKSKMKSNTRASRAFFAIVEGLKENIKLGRGVGAARRLVRVLSDLDEGGSDLDFVGVDMTNEWDGVFVNLKFKVVPQFVRDDSVIEIEAGEVRQPARLEHKQRAKHDREREDID